MTTQQTPRVTQADRDLVARWTKVYWEAHGILSGKSDHHPFVQDVARHRAQAEATAAREIEALRGEVLQHGWNAVTAAKEYAENMAAMKDLLRECLRWLPLLDSHEAGSTTDLLCDRIRAAIAKAKGDPA